MMTRFISLFILLMITANSYGQEVQGLLSLDSAYQLQRAQTQVRSQSKNQVHWHAFYKRNFSELLSGNCQFSNTCSHFMKDATHEFGFKGFLLGVNRLIRCGSSDYIYTVFPTFVDKQSQTITDPVSDYE